MHSQILNEYKEVCPSLIQLLASVLAEWPEHAKFVDSAFKGINLGFVTRMDEVAELVLMLSGDDLPRYAADYRWMCDRFIEEQLYFARKKRYRLSTLKDAAREVYENTTFMSRYLNGILISQVLWRNHADALDIFRTIFLPGNKANYNHLDIGPGHGLFLAFASMDKSCASLTAWDISPTSLQSTRYALEKMGVTRDVALNQMDIVCADPVHDQFESIACSEVLEHTEDPETALKNICRALCANGRLFLNIPVNSPAPDHIYLWRRSEDVKSFITSNDLDLDFFAEIPLTGRTLEQAKRRALNINCIAVARKKPNGRSLEEVPA